MNDATLLIIAIAFVAGFLLGWLVEWRIDMNFWNRNIARLNRRDALRRAQTDLQIERAELEAEQQIDHLRRQLQAEIAELRARSEEQIAAARARIELGSNRNRS